MTGYVFPHDRLTAPDVTLHVLRKLKEGVSFVRIFLSDGRVYDATLDDVQGISFQEKAMRPVGSPFVVQDEQLSQLEKNWGLDRGLDAHNSWVPEE